MYPGSRLAGNENKLAVQLWADGPRMTFGEMEAAANQLAHQFRADGLARLDHVAYLLDNSLEMIISQAAGERSGLYYTCVSTHLRAGEAAWIINDCRAKVVITTSRLLEVAAELRALCPNVDRWVMVDRPEDLTGFDDFAGLLASQPSIPISDEQLGAPMLYSSGTTGRPKGILRPVADSTPHGTAEFMETVRAVFQMREGMTFLNPAPLYHSGPQASTSVALRLAASTIVMPKFDPEGFLAAIATHHVTHTVVVPTMFYRLLQLPQEVRDRYDLSSLEAITHMGGPCAAPVKRAMINWVGPILWENYGTTEANGGTGCSSPEWLARPGTVGKSRLGEIVIRSADGETLPVGEIGEIWFRGPTNFEYFNDPEKTLASRSADGSMSSTGDIGYLDADGYLYLTDRKDFMIVSGGVNIYPQEIESVLMGHPDVADVAVIGVPNVEFGEEVKALVELRQGVDGDEVLAESIRDYCRSQLASLKVPRSVDFTDQLPRTPLGKLVKGEIKAKYWPQDASLHG